MRPEKVTRHSPRSPRGSRSESGTYQTTTSVLGLPSERQLCGIHGSEGPSADTGAPASDTLAAWWSEALGAGPGSVSRPVLAGPPQAPGPSGSPQPVLPQPAEPALTSTARRKTRLGVKSTLPVA